MKERQRYVVRNRQIRDNVERVVQELPVPEDCASLEDVRLWEVEIREFKSKRSLAQNSLLWMWNNAIQQHMADHFGQIASAEEWHDILVSRLLPSKVRRVELPGGEGYKVGRTRTSQLTVKRMTEYLDLLNAYCAEYLRLQLPQPIDLMMQAMGRAT
ncbi:recombination protein NinB [Marinobacter salarius]|uniref:recombination protein NinB n=1 Tax=Marinobacter salarius TaxID=1420917 RepID=UPI003D0F4850